MKHKVTIRKNVESYYFTMEDLTDRFSIFIDDKQIEWPDMPEAIFDLGRLWEYLSVRESLELSSEITFIEKNSVFYITNVNGGSKGFTKLTENILFNHIRQHDPTKEKG